ncbi:MAG: helix-turn-helix domain-containing protein, partial [Anaerolineales bacterium]|nr:helix-turn-helix domain-containing protein [Anaerolineales bacterium]
MSHLPDLQEEKVERKRAFAVLLRKHRKAVSLTQKLLAELAGFERKAVMRWENADIEAMPDREAIMKMAVPLKLTDVARDMLLATAGYLPENQETFFEPAPIQSEIKPQLDRMEGKLD